MNAPSLAKKTLLACAAILLTLPLAFLPCAANAQTSHPKAATQNHEPQQHVEQELVRIETGFFEAWKSKDESYFREHMLENGVFWGDSGTFPRDQQLQQQQASAKACTVEGYGLSDFGVLPLSAGAYLLTYRAEQYATCNGEKEPVHMNGSSVYIFKAGRWQAIYRAEVPLKNQS